MDFPIELFFKVFWSIIVSLGFAVLFNTPKRALWVVAFLGALGFGIKLMILEIVFPEQIVFATFVGATLVGILGSFFSHKVHTPPIVFTIPAIINMIPGKYGYEFIIGIFKIVNSGKNNSISFEFFMEVINNGLKTGFNKMQKARYLGKIYR